MFFSVAGSYFPQTPPLDGLSRPVVGRFTLTFNETAYQVDVEDETFFRSRDFLYVIIRVAVRKQDAC